MTIDGSIESFSPFHNINCPKGFLYFNKQVHRGRLFFSGVLVLTSVDSPVCVMFKGKIPPGRNRNTTLHFVLMFSYICCCRGDSSYSKLYLFCVLLFFALQF